MEGEQRGGAHNQSPVSARLCLCHLSQVPSLGPSFPICHMDIKHISWMEGGGEVEMVGVSGSLLVGGPKPRILRTLMYVLRLFLGRLKNNLLGKKHERVLDSLILRGSFRKLYWARIWKRDV